MRARHLSWRQRIRLMPHSLLEKIKQPPFITAIIVILIIFAIFTFLVLIFGWNWTGFNGGYSKITTTSTTHGVTTATEKPLTKTLWDWLNLLGVLAIPVVVGFGVAWFTAQQGKVSNRENKDNQQEVALQEYIKEMSALLLERNLRKSDAEAEVRTIARVRTLTILSRLDGHRKRSVLQFLHESGLISKGQHPGAKSVVDLSGADLSEADLSGVKLLNVDLWEADLSGADLRNTWWEGVELWDRGEYPPKMQENPRLPGPGVRLPMQHYSKVRYPAVDLSGANLSGAKLINADLSGADLSGAYMSGVNLSGANLKGASGKTKGESATKSSTGRQVATTTTMDISKALEESSNRGQRYDRLKGTIMPNGDVHP